ncbi:MAG: NUDIX domain-containing protein [Armatimonadota bacterium]
MISFRKDNFQFNYRAAAIITRTDATNTVEVLVTTESHLPFCYLPGGRVEMGEEARAALEREIWEELHKTAEVGDLLVVAETFHPHSDGLQGHNVELYFAVSLPSARKIYEAAAPFPGSESEPALTFFWQRPDATGDDVRSLVPLFLRDLLSKPLPSSPVHIIHREP